MSVKKAFSNRKFVNWEQNVSITSSDLTNIGNLRVQEIAELKQRLFTDSKDLLIESSVAQIVQSGIPAMTVDVNPLTAINGTNGETSITDSVEVGFPLDASDPGQDRIDIIEIRLTFEKSDLLTRKVVDPSDGSVSNLNKETRQTANVEIQAVTGTPAGSPVAPSKTGTDWIKITEIFVGAAVTTILNADIRNVDAFIHGENTDWTTEKDITGLFKNAAAIARRGFEPWVPNVFYKIGDKFENSTVLFKTVTDHTSDADISVDLDAGRIIAIGGIPSSSLDANAIINPDGFVFQRAFGTNPGPDATFAAGTNADGDYRIDRWKVMVSNDDTEVAVGQRDSSDSFFISMGATSKKIGILQYILGTNVNRFTPDLTGTGKASISFQVKHDDVSVHNIRVGLIQSTDNFDNPNNDPISGAWGGSKPALINGSYTYAGTTGDDDFSIPVSGDFTKIIIEDIDVLDCNNLALFIYTPDAHTSVEWNFRNVQLSPRPSLPTLSKRFFSEELNRCKFYFERFVGTDQGGGTNDGDIMARGFVTSATSSSFYLPYRRKRKLPTFNSGAVGLFSVFTSSATAGVVSGIGTSARRTLVGLEINTTHATVGGPQIGDPAYLICSDGQVASLDVDAEI